MRQIFYEYSYQSTQSDSCSPMRNKNSAIFASLVNWQPQEIHQNCTIHKTFSSSFPPAINHAHLLALFLLFRRKLFHFTFSSSTWKESMFDFEVNKTGSIVWHKILQINSKTIGNISLFFFYFFLSRLANEWKG